jgi:hypothetical protein
MGIKGDFFLHDPKDIFCYGIQLQQNLPNGLCL